MKILPLMSFFVLICGGAFAQTNLVVNGGFEDNGGVDTSVFRGWTVVNQGSGSWVVQKGTLPPTIYACRNDIVQPPPSGVAAMTSQSDPGSHILYQDVAIPASAGPIVLSYDIFYSSFADLSSPPTLDYHVKPNQQLRVDIVDPAAALTDVGSGVLANVYQTTSSDPLFLQSYVTHTFDLSRFAGRSIRLRIAEVDNGECFHAGIDNVSITTGACPTAAPGTVLVSYRGASSNCGATATPCFAAEQIAFSPSTAGYAFQACDTYAWDFGDGTTSSAMSPAHSYDAAGTYTVRFTVTNSLGTQVSGPATIVVLRLPRRRAAGH